MIDAFNMMTVKPYVLPMHPAEFLSFVDFATRQDGYIKAFVDETGADMSAFFRSPIDRMVDKACGHDPRREVLAKFMDWLAVNYWGMDDEGERNEHH